MSVRYVPVKWNPNKRRYDATIAACILAYLAAFLGIGRIVWSGDLRISDEVLLIRGVGTCALLMLHVVLCLGPLARLDRRFLPLVYNRRHLGVATFLMALAHGLLVLGYYHGFGQISPLRSLLTANDHYVSLADFPFEMLGVAALAILLALAATSHDFWQKALAPSAWKSLHMAVYVAYFLTVMHVALGAMQSERSLAYPILLGMGAALVAGLHLSTGLREARRDRAAAKPVDDASGDSWADAGLISGLIDGRARVVTLPAGERVAVFRFGNRISAVTNVCAHQRGPLGEGKIVDGCITCPWHGWEYRPEDGRSPPPFGERIATYRIRVVDQRIQIDPRALPPGTAVEPALFEEPADDQPQQASACPESACR